MMKSRVVRYVLVGALTAAFAIPMIASMLQAQQEQEPAAAQPQVVQPQAAQPMPAPPQAAQVEDDRVVIRIGDQTITAGEFNRFISDLPPQYQAMAMGPAKRMFAEELVRFRLLAAEARRRGLDQTDRFERQMAMIRDQVLASSLVEQVQGEVDENAARAYYEQNREQFEGVSARHILVSFEGARVPLREGKEPRTEEQAKAHADQLRARIEAGEDFAELARAESDDTMSGARGGDLGTFGRGDMIAEFEQAAFAMREGEVSQPVRSEFGYHIIQLRERVMPALDEVLPEIEQQLGPDRVMAMIDQLQEQHPAELDEEFFGPANAQPALPFGMEMD